MNKTIIAVAALLALLIPSTPTMARKMVSDKKVHAFGDMRKPSLYIDLLDGDRVTVEGIEAGGFTIKENRIAEASSRAIAEARMETLETEVVRVKEIVYLKSLRKKASRKENRGVWDKLVGLFEVMEEERAFVEFTVLIPKGGSVKLSSNGRAREAKISGMKGPVVMTGTFSTVDVSDCAGTFSYSGNDHSDSILVRNHDGHLSLRGKGDTTIISGCKGRIGLNWGSGRVDVTDSVGQFTLDFLGKIRMSGCSGPVKAKGQDGEISVLNHGPGNLFISTRDGNILVSTPLCEGSIDLETHSGNISVAYGKDSVFDLNIRSEKDAVVDLSRAELVIKDLTFNTLRGYFRKQEGAKLGIVTSDGLVEIIPNSDIPEAR